VLKNEAKLQQPGNNNQQVKNNKPHKTAHDRQSLYSDQHTRTTNKENSKAQIRFKTAVCHYPVNKVGVRFLMSMVEGNEARLNPVPDTSWVKLIAPLNVGERRKAKERHAPEQN
jgi:hypothetical protein